MNWGSVGYVFCLSNYINNRAMVVIEADEEFLLNELGLPNGESGDVLCNVG